MFILSLAFILVVIVLLLLGQLFYRRKRKAAYGIWIFTVILNLTVVIDSKIKPSYIRKTETSIVGKYSIDVYHSIYDSLPIQENYRNVVLVVSPNNSMFLNMRTPFFVDTLGEWNLYGDGD